MLTRAGGADLSRAEWMAGKGQGRAVEQGDCTHCEKRGIECMPLTEGKVTTCAACQLMRVKCIRPGEELVEPKVTCWRKRTEDELLWEKKK